MNILVVPTSNTCGKDFYSSSSSFIHYCSQKPSLSLQISPMNAHSPTPSSFNPKTNLRAPSRPTAFLATTNNETISFSIKLNIGRQGRLIWDSRSFVATKSRISAAKPKADFLKLSNGPLITKASNKKGTIAGAVALIIGTSIGSGILALPSKASPAGIIPSSMILCWGFLLIEALLLVEINVTLLKKTVKNETDDGELQAISIRTMAQKTLGELGGNLASVTYLFLGYTSMVAYSSKAGEILYHLINIPQPISGSLFTIVFTVLISVGGTRATDQVNLWLTALMIGLLVAIEVLAVIYGGWSGIEGGGDWGEVPATVPVMIFSLVYHDLAPVLCAYLGGDIRRIRLSVCVGSLVPLLALLVWDAIALSLAVQSDQQIDPVQLLSSVKWSGVSFMVEFFSLLAVGTSLIGTLLSFSEFFKEQLIKLASQYTSTKSSENSNKSLTLGKWRGGKRLGLVAKVIVVAPTLLVSTTFPDAFSTATDIAGGYCMIMLYGVLPPAMAWAMFKKESENSKVLSRAGPALLGIGLLAGGIVMEQMLQNLAVLPSLDHNR